MAFLDSARNQWCIRLVLVGLAEQSQHQGNLVFAGMQRYLQEAAEEFRLLKQRRQLDTDTDVMDTAA